VHEGGHIGHRQGADRGAPWTDFPAPRWMPARVGAQGIVKGQIQVPSGEVVLPPLVGCPRGAQGEVLCYGAAGLCGEVGAVTVATAPFAIAAGADASGKGGAGGTTGACAGQGEATSEAVGAAGGSAGWRAGIGGAIAGAAPLAPQAGSQQPAAGPDSAGAGAGACAVALSVPAAACARTSVGAGSDAGGSVAIGGGPPEGALAPMQGSEEASAGTGAEGGADSTLEFMSVALDEQEVPADDDAGVCSAGCRQGGSQSREADEDK